MKLKYYGEEVAGFYNKKIPEVDSDHTCLAVISLDSAFSKGGICYPQIFLKECKHIEKKIILKYIIDYLESLSDNSDEE